MNIHQSKYFSLISLLCGLSLIPATFTPLIVLNKINQVKSGEHREQLSVNQCTNQRSQVEDTWLINRDQLSADPTLALSHGEDLNDLEILMQKLVTNCESESSKLKQGNQIHLTQKSSENSAQVKSSTNDHSNQLELANPSKDWSTSKQSQLRQRSIKQIIARIDQVIPPTVATCVISGLIAGGAGLASLVGPASLATIALGAGTVSLEYLSCSLMLIGAKKILENLPPSLNDCLKTLLNSTHFESLQKLIEWLKAGLNSCTDLAKFTENYAWISFIKHAFDNFVELLGFTQQPTPKKLLV